MRDSLKAVTISGNILRQRRLRLILTVACVIVSGCSYGAPEFLSQGENGGITKGPMLLRAYQTRAAIMWETGSERPCKLQYGKEGKLTEEIESKGEKVQYKSSEVGKGKIERTVFIHKEWLKGLEAGTLYSYRITGEGIKSKVYKFQTAPINSDRVRFIVYGDSRTRPEVHRKLVNLMIDKKVDFVVHGGDMVTDGSKYEQWEGQFFKPLKGLGETIPIYGVKGNHEGTGGNYERLLVPEGEKNNFGFDYGPVHYFCADNAIKNGEPNKILELIANDIKNSKARWKFVSYHRPSLNFGHHWSAWGYPEALGRFAEAGVDFVITGHSHQYERFRPIAPAADGGSYVTYITSGGGGAPLSGIKPNDYHVKATSKNHFCLFEINGEKLTMDTINIEGKTIDHLEIRKDAGRLNEEFVLTAIPMDQIQRQQKDNLSREK
jgi:predicted phosphodiesterase